MFCANIFRKKFIFSFIFSLYIQINTLNLHIFANNLIYCLFLRIIAEFIFIILYTLLYIEKKHRRRSHLWEVSSIHHRRRSHLWEVSSIHRHRSHLWEVSSIHRHRSHLWEVSSIHRHRSHLWEVSSIHRRRRSHLWRRWHIPSTPRQGGARRSPSGRRGSRG